MGLLHSGNEYFWLRCGASIDSFPDVLSVPPPHRSPGRVAVGKALEIRAESGPLSLALDFLTLLCWPA